jgi:hypothetical protein
VAAAFLKSRQVDDAIFEFQGRADHVRRLDPQVVTLAQGLE